MKQLIKLGPVFLFLCAIGFGLQTAKAQIPVEKSDAKILGVIAVIDHNEIQAAQLAQQKNINHKIFDYAQMLDKEHSEHLGRTHQLAHELGIEITEKSHAADRLRDKGEKDLAALTVLNGEAFAQMYIRDMVKGHLEALNWLDKQDSQNERVRKFIHETRGHVAMHLDKAQKLQEHQRDHNHHD